MRMGRGELVGLAALLSVVIEILKKYGVIPDGLAGLVAFLANAIVLTHKVGRAMELPLFKKGA